MNRRGFLRAAAGAVSALVATPITALTKPATKPRVGKFLQSISKKRLTEGSGSTGGYVVPKQFVEELILLMRNDTAIRGVPVPFRSKVMARPVIFESGKPKPKPPPKPKVG